jgi:hypothetical protein
VLIRRSDPAHLAGNTVAVAVPSFGSPHAVSYIYIRLILPCSPIRSGGRPLPIAVTLRLELEGSPQPDCSLPFLNWHSCAAKKRPDQAGAFLL